MDRGLLIRRVQDALVIDAVSTGIWNEPRTRSIPRAPADIVEIHGLGQHEERVGVETGTSFCPWWSR